MPLYKLCYFNSKGLAEMSRLIFAEAGVSFEDTRYTKEEWIERRPNMLFHTVPVLFVDGEQIAHSRAIVRYLAREFKLEGGNALTAAKMDMWIETLMEAVFTLPFSEQDEKKKAELLESAFKESILPKFTKLDQLIAKNEGTYVFGNTITALDFVVYATLTIVKEKTGKDLLDQLPHVKALMAAIESRPKIAEWLKAHPV